MVCTQQLKVLLGANHTSNQYCLCDMTEGDIVSFFTVKIAIREGILTNIADLPCFGILFDGVDVIPVNAMWRKLLYSGFKTRFGPSTQAQFLLASHFEKKGRNVRF